MTTLSLLGVLLVGCSGDEWVTVDSATVTVDSAADSGSTEIVGGAPEEFPIDFSPPGGTFTNAVQVSLASVDGAQITYTTDGSVPVPGEDLVYATPIPIGTSTVVRAVATYGDDQGEVTSRSYVKLDASVAGFTSNLPIVVLHSMEEAPTTKESHRTPFTVNLMEPGPDGRATMLGDATLSLRTGLKVRGSSTNGQPKLHYSIELWGDGIDDDYDAEVLGMPSESDWVLHAPLYFDRALMRNALVYRWSNALGVYAPRTRFAEVYVADWGEAVTSADYMGVYTVMERIKRDEARVAITRLEPGDVTEPEVSGGYIFKRDRLGSGESGFYAGTANGSFSFAQPLVWVDPAEDEVVQPQEDWLVDYLDNFAAALAAPSHTHPGNGAHYTAWIDLDSWIDHHLINVLPMNPDAFRLSGYLYKDREGLLAAGPVWDFDRTMNCSSDSRPDTPTYWDPSYKTRDTTYFFEHGWYRGLFDDPEFAAVYWDRWREVIDAEYSLVNLLAEVDEMAAELSESAPRNFERWKDYPPRGNGTFAAEVEILEDWLQERHAWIKACLDLPDPELCAG